MTTITLEVEAFARQIAIQHGIPFDLALPEAKIKMDQYRDVVAQAAVAKAQAEAAAVPHEPGSASGSRRRCGRLSSSVTH